MSHWEASGKSNEWYTPEWLFEALGCTFDLDVAAPVGGPLHVPASVWFSCDGLTGPWDGFVWMNPPFGGRNSLAPWLDKFFAHGNGIALTPDRTSAPWWQDAAKKADCILFIAGKIRFIRPDGTEGKSPSNGTTLFATGSSGIRALHRAAKRGVGFLSTSRLEVAEMAA